MAAAARPSSPPLVVVMGVSGVGKTRIGTELAARYDVPYADGDTFHPRENVAKMAAGIPLTEDDRWPWLKTIGEWLHVHDERGAVVSCSALRRAYRDLLVGIAPRIVFLHLVGDLDLVRARMQAREHFMPVALLDSQQAALEPLETDENGCVIDVGQPPADIVAEFLEKTERDATE